MTAGVLGLAVRERRRGLLGWAIGVVALAAIVSASYPAVADAPALNETLRDAPEELIAVFGGGETEITSPAGYLDSQLFAFMAPLVFLVFAVGFGAGTLAGEEERGTLELELANPVTRRRVVLEKYGALVALVAALGAVLWLALSAMRGLVDLDISAGRLFAAVGGTVLLAHVFGALALAVGAATGRRGTAIGVAVSAAVATYLLDALGLIVDALDPWRPISPFFHAVGGNPLREGIDPGGWGLLAAEALMLIAAAVAAFERRDLRVR